MTRLRTDDIADIATNLTEYDSKLLWKTGCNLKGIACRAVGIDEEIASSVIEASLVAVVPTTCGLGVIPGFANTIKEIAKHIGFKAFVTEEADVCGLAESFEKKANIIMLADDDRFVAINVKYGRVVDNTEATGRGYVAALNQMAGGLNGQSVLVIGCGKVGRATGVALLRLGAELSVYDVDKRRGNDIAVELKSSFSKEINVEEKLEEVLGKYRCLIDASPAANIIDEKHIFEDTIICAPGMPHGLSSGALKKISSRFLHDPLQIGVATMIVDVVTGKT